jgi:hypothetical protein
LRRSKKGYFFILDAFIGSAILFVALLIVLNSGVKPSKVQQDYSVAEDFSSFLMNTKIQDLNNVYIRETLIANGVIEGNDVRNSIVEQIDKFYYTAYYNLSCKASTTCPTLYMDYARKMTQNITDPLMPDKYGFDYTLIYDGNRVSIYNRSTETLANSNLVIVSSKITFLQINTAEMFGPAIVEIKVWLK